MKEAADFGVIQAEFLGQLYFSAILNERAAVK